MHYVPTTPSTEEAATAVSTHRHRTERRRAALQGPGLMGPKTPIGVSHAVRLFFHAAFINAPMRLVRRQNVRFVSNPAASRKGGLLSVALSTATENPTSNARKLSGITQLTEIYFWRVLLFFYFLTFRGRPWMQGIKNFSAKRTGGLWLGLKLRRPEYRFFWRRKPEKSRFLHNGGENYVFFVKSRWELGVFRKSAAIYTHRAIKSHPLEISEDNCVLKMEMPQFEEMGRLILERNGLELKKMLNFYRKTCNPLHPSINEAVFDIGAKVHKTNFYTRYDTHVTLVWFYIIE